MRGWLGGVAIVIGCALATLGAQQSLRELFERARMLEESNQDLARAIALYVQVADAAASGSRDLAATARLRAGLLQERLGQHEDARRSFRTVIDKHAESHQAVVRARARLDAIDGTGAKSSTAFATRRVQADSFDISGSVSRDGRYLTLTDWETGDIAVRDLASGASRRLTNKGSWTDSPAFGEFTLIAPDNGHIVYAWCDKPGCELRIVAREGGAPRVLYRNPDVEYAQPCDWSPDGSQILAVLTRGDRSNQIALVSAATGSVRVLKTLSWGGPPWKMAFSPDGRYIAYEFPPVTGSLKRDLFLLAVDGSREQPLVQHPANEFLLGWFPDGRHMFFASDRLGTNGAWAIGVVDGKPQGEPRLVKPAIGKIFGMGFTRQRDYYYAQSMGVRDVFVAALDADGLASGGAQPLPGPEGGRLSGAWSPDGERIAFLTQTPEVKGDTGRVVSIRDMKSGAVRDIALQMNYASNIFWFPDARALLIQGRDARGRGGVFRLDLSTDAIEPLVFDVDRVGGISRDGRSLFYQSALSPGVVEHDLVTGAKRVVVAGSASGIELSWNRQWLAVRTGAPSPELQVVAVADGTRRTLLKLEPTDALGLGRAFAWSRGDTHVLFTRGRELWRAAIEGGTPNRIGSVSFPLEGGTRLSLHPDGNRLAVSGGTSQWELWVMENLQPPGG